MAQRTDWHPDSQQCSGRKASQEGGLGSDQSDPSRWEPSEIADLTQGQRPTDRDAGGR